ncbi:MAG: KH domain-containing protein [Actinomycetota bacterium]
MRELVEFLACQLVDDPDGVEVTESFDDRGARYTLSVAPEDMGKVIGRGGRTAKAIRSVVRVAATRQGTSAYVDIVDR